MISIIIIGRNEGSKLEKCFNSIRQFIKLNNLSGTEIIYADSESEDNSLIVAQKFEEIKILQLYGRCNAASGRNVGARYASNDFLLFADGDMELLPEFYHLITDDQNRIKYDFVSGQIENYYYDKNGKFIYKEEYYKLNSPVSYHSTTGGLFLIKRELWESLNGMRNRYRNGEDLDLGMRMAQQGTKLVRLSAVMAKHHTVQYFDHERMWKDLFRGLTLESRGVLYRIHLLKGNRYIIPRMVKSDPTVFVLIISIILIPFVGFLIPMALYLTMLIVALSLFTKIRGIIDFCNRLFYQVCRDIITLVSFFFYYPSDYQSTFNEFKV